MLIIGYTEHYLVDLSLTFDANKHELVERQGAVVSHNIGRLDTSQADLAEVLLAGEACQGHVSQVGVLCHWVGE